jgi:hypothetical protein
MIVFNIFAALEAALILGIDGYFISCVATAR